MLECDSTEILDFIQNKAKELGLPIIGFGSVIELEKNQIKFYADKNFIKISEGFPEAKSYISAALSYKSDWNSLSSGSEGYIARYTTANYYKILSNKLKILARSIFEKVKFKDKKLFRVFVNSKVNDKLSGSLCLPCWTGKNTLLMNKELGSQFVIGELFLPFNLKREKIKVAENCFECTKCIESCPTGALNQKCEINKNICIQHLSTALEWPETINSKNFLEYWGLRFFGCTDCVDECPYNNNNNACHNDKDQLIGFVGNNFDLMNVLKFKKGDYKSFFKNNQISSSWIPEIALVRNCLAAIFNLGKISILKEFFKNLDFFNFDENEKEYLVNFKKKFLKI
jgi:epoxyqueuosine reductase QueG